jgi:sterol 3beta-glucosyltransferase
MSDRLGVPLVRVLFHAPTYWMARGSSGPMGKAARQLVWLAARPWLNAVRRQALRLPPVPLREPISELARRKMPVLYPASPAVFPMPHHAGEAAAVTGYWFLDSTLDPDPSPELHEFLASGPPPVYIGFGTQIDVDPAATTELMAEALRIAGRRGVLLRPPGATGHAAPRDDILVVSAVAHQWLFPRCAAVVHHAASGTTAAGLRAGVPTVPVPDNSDQFSWAKRIYELGVASRPIPRRKLTAADLAAAITTVTSEQAIQRRAASLGETIRAEHGVDRAVAHFERWVVQPPRSRRAGRPSATPATVDGLTT